MNTGRFREFVVNNNPDYIVSTHFMTSEICVHLKNRGKIKSRVVTIITDFGVHPFWITNGTDIYITASEFGKKKLISEKIPEDKIRVFGLPSDDKFLGSFNRKEIALKLGISFDRFTVLLMTGSFGVGPLEEIAKAICNDVQVLLVCAGNKKLFDKMTKINLPNVKVFAFIHNTEELMAVSDIIITKPGGSTISEIINMELVPIFIAAIPGQETGNAQAMKELGIGVYPLGVEEVEVAVLNYKNHPELMEAQKNKLRIMKKPSSCKEIASVIR
jgi:processive 1,2-diacylglycerol beta-glucosyltransferase